MIVRQLIRNTRGASAAEFALVLPAALLMLFGVIDVGRYAWQLNEYEKATQMGARMAVVTNVVSLGLAADELTYVGSTACGPALIGGERICADALPLIVCTVSGCECEGGCPMDDEQVDGDAFGLIVDRIRQFQPRVTDEQVAIEYRGSGIGFAGDPGKPEISPIVTVRILNAQYDAVTLSPLGGTVPLPDFSYSLTLEDGEGTLSG